MSIIDDPDFYFAASSDSSLAMDLFYPTRTLTPAPMVFNIHGGVDFSAIAS
jgi:hypothetical protein